uniref:Uncharacterized protein n=1 Tax=Tanacetum cinerariifolium TaxID=118510 RepID=A0A6L2NVL8_TANCI|nr:hypothetical protein [Tanacetum cinerariifolium]
MWLAGESEKEESCRKPLKGRQLGSWQSALGRDPDTPGMAVGPRLKIGYSVTDAFGYAIIMIWQVYGVIEVFGYSVTNVVMA